MRLNFGPGEGSRDAAGCLPVSWYHPAEGTEDWSCGQGLFSAGGSSKKVTQPQERGWEGFCTHSTSPQSYFLMNDVKEFRNSKQCPLPGILADVAERTCFAISTCQVALT